VRRWGAVVPVALLALAACGGDDATEAAPRRTTTTAEAAPPEATTPVPTLPVAGTGTCTDEGADTAELTPGADLLRVDVSQADGGLRVRFGLVGPVPTTGTTLWSVFARPPGGTNVQLAARLQDGTATPFVFHFGDEIEQDLPAGAMAVGTDSVEVTFPAAAVGSLRPPFDWRAESTVEVEDVDYCPGGAGTTVLDDTRLHFPG
jgi:hypothetical protein